MNGSGRLDAPAPRPDQIVWLEALAASPLKKMCLLTSLVLSDASSNARKAIEDTGTLACHQGGVGPWRTMALWSALTRRRGRHRRTARKTMDNARQSAQTPLYSGQCWSIFPGYARM